MDNAVGLVQAYLRLNGYFTVSEYPVVAAAGDGSYRTATDLDILAFRFPHSGRVVPGRERHGARDEHHTAIDAALGAPSDHADMIVGEVKEGRAALNDAAVDPGVLRAALVAFGCCPPADVADVVETLLRQGRASIPVGHDIRFVLFGSVTSGGGQRRHRTISLHHVLGFLRAYIRQHWEVLRHGDSKDPVFGMLMTLAKAEQGSP